MLVFPLKKKWFEKIASGEKKIEYREVKKYWASRLFNAGCMAYTGQPWDYYALPKNSLGFIFAPWCVLQCGYTNKRLYARVVKVEIVNGKETDLRIDKPVFAIHIEDVGKFPKGF